MLALHLGLQKHFEPLTGSVDHEVLVVFVNVEQFNQLKLIELVNVEHDVFPDNRE